MKYILLLLLLFCSPLMSGGCPAQHNVENLATVKVLLEKNVQGLLIEARGPFVVYNPKNGKKVSRGRYGKRSYCYPHKQGIKWGEDFVGIFQLQFQPTSPDTTFLINGVQYRGAINVYHIEDMLSVVNEVDVESFLKSTLSAKVHPTLPDVVLDAIAIVERTHTYYTVLANHQSFWHVDAKEVNYNGMGLILQHLSVDCAIDHTSRLIMTYNNQPFPALWTEHCGGQTANYSPIFRKDVSTPDGVHSPFAESSRQDFYWTLTLENQEFAKLMKTNRITGIDLFVDPNSNKVYAVRVHDGIHSEDIYFCDLQKLLGKDRLKSNDFMVNIKGNNIIFEGYGDGAGVGLCLYSATQMTERGDTTPQILASFFPDSQLEKMDGYPLIVSPDKHLFISSQRQSAFKKRSRLLHK